MENTREQQHKEQEEKDNLSGAQQRKEAFDKKVDEQKNKGNDDKDKKVPDKDDTIFINLSSGTVMLTGDGEFNGRYQDGKMMISSQKVSKITNGQVKAQYIPFPYSDVVRLFQALDEHKTMIMEQVEKERSQMISLTMDRKA